MIGEKAFGKTGHLSTRAIFGGASMGRDGLSEAESEKTLDLLLKYGVNHLDLAASYGKGMAERRVGGWCCGRCSNAATRALRFAPG